AMTRGATRQLLDLVFLDQAPSELALVRWRLVVDTEDRVARAHVLLRIPVTVEAPFHLKRLRLPHERHPIDRAMTRRTADAFVDMDAVVEVHEVRQIVHAGPLNRLARSEARAHRLEVRTVRKNLRVAVHARLRRWNPGEA